MVGGCDSSPGANDGCSPSTVIGWTRPRCVLPLVCSGASVIKQPVEAVLTHFSRLGIRCDDRFFSIHTIEMLTPVQIVYSLLLVPVAITRFFQFGGAEIPFWATILTDTLFNLQGKLIDLSSCGVRDIHTFTVGLANAILLITTRRIMSETASLPSFSAPRKVIDTSSSEAMGITPFVLPPPDPSDQQEAKTTRSGPPSLYRSTSVASTGTVDSQSSVDSRTPLNGEK